MVAVFVVESCHLQMSEMRVGERYPSNSRY
jgi:hypothetical protein